MPIANEKNGKVLDGDIWMQNKETKNPTTDAYLRTLGCRILQLTRLCAK